MHGCDSNYITERLADFLFVAIILSFSDVASYPGLGTRLSVMLRTDLAQDYIVYNFHPVAHFDLIRSAVSRDVKKPFVPLPHGRIGKAVGSVRPSSRLHIPQQIVVEARFAYASLPSQNHLIHRRRSGCHV